MQSPRTNEALGRRIFLLYNSWLISRSYTELSKKQERRKRSCANFLVV